MENMDYKTAMDCLNDGCEVSRKSFNGLWLVKFSQSHFIVVNAENHQEIDIEKQGWSSFIDDGKIDHIGVISDDGNYYPFEDFILIKNKENKMQPWFPSADDLIATDYYKLENLFA